MGVVCRRFWATVISNGPSYAIRDILLSVLSVTLVYCGQTVGWIRMPLGTEVGLGPGDMVTQPPSGKGAQQVATFRIMSTEAKRSPISASAELVFVCVLNISETAERICAKFTRKTCLVPHLDKFEGQSTVKGQGHKGQKTAFSALSAACMRAVCYAKHH